VTQPLDASVDIFGMKTMVSQAECRRAASLKLICDKVHTSGIKHPLFVLLDSLQRCRQILVQHFVCTGGLGFPAEKR
jgi:hypothetical protein